MAQFDWGTGEIIVNGTGSAVRSDLNDAYSALFSSNSGTSSPVQTRAYMKWADTTSGKMKLRNSANTDWVELYNLDGSTGSIFSLAPVTVANQNSVTFTGIPANTKKIKFIYRNLSFSFANAAIILRLGTASGMAAGGYDSHALRITDVGPNNIIQMITSTTGFDTGANTATNSFGGGAATFNYLGSDLWWMEGICDITTSNTPATIYKTWGEVQLGGPLTQLQTILSIGSQNIVTGNFNVIYEV